MLLGYAPWIFTIGKAAQVSSNLGQNIGWIERPNLTTVFQFLFDLIEPFYYQQSNIESPSILAITLPVLLLIITAFAIYLIELKGAPKEEKQTVILLVILLKAPILLALMASWILPYSVWGTRHLIFAFAPFAILTAMTLTKNKVAAIAAIFVSLIILIFALAFYIQTVREKPVLFECAWANLANTLDKTKPAKIYAFEDLVAYDTWFALRAAGTNFEIIKVNGTDLPEDKAYFLPRGFDKIQITDENEMNGDRFYVIYRDSIFNELHPPLHNLRAKGYKIGAPVTFETPGLKGILVEVLEMIF